jgi:hypothetical protein
LLGKPILANKRNNLLAAQVSTVICPALGDENSSLLLILGAELPGKENSAFG